MPTNDRTLLKHMGAAQARFETLAAQALPGAARLSEEEMDAMLQVGKHAVRVRRVQSEGWCTQVCYPCCLCSGKRVVLRRTCVARESPG